METSVNNPVEMKSAQETNNYFWNNDLLDIATDLDREHPSQEVLSLDKDTVIKRLANTVKCYYPPRTNRDDLRTKFYARALEDAVNDYGFNYKAFAEYVVQKYHRTIQQSTMRLVMAIIKEFANMGEHNTDARNSETHRIAKLLNEVLEKEGYSLPMI